MTVKITLNFNSYNLEGKWMVVKQERRIVSLPAISGLAHQALCKTCAATLLVSVKEPGGGKKRLGAHVKVKPS